MHYKPDGWQVLKYIKKDGTGFFKIFATWRADDRWRLSSGADRLADIEVQDDFLIWHQKSGSVYNLSINRQNYFTHYTQKILNEKIIPTISEGGINVSVIDLLNEKVFDYEKVRDLDFQTNNEQDDFEALFNKIENPKDPLSIFKASEKDLAKTFEPSKTEN